MLQQILKDMYVDPELLAELSEHQKQLLFVKMREEQVRRWEAFDKKNPPKRAPKPGRKRVDWLLGRDGCEWVWVMGEHRDDLTLEQILEKENKKEAAILAQKEAEEKRKREEEERRRKEKEEEEKRRKLLEEEERLRKEKERLEEERKRAEREAYASMKELRLQKEKLEREEAEKRRKEQELREKQEQLRKQKEEEERKRKEREEQLAREEALRREELYMSLKKIREEQKKAAMREREQADEIFRKQLRESKKADRDRSFRAKAARDEVRRSRALSQDLSNLNIQEMLDRKIVPGDDMGAQQPPEGAQQSPRKRQAPRPPKPTGHKSVVEWFQKDETKRHAGLIKETKKVAPWFHGIITRQQAEYLLYPHPCGHFLIRVSERIWGYALSFRDKERAKHFLIDASGERYSFFGQDQKYHDSLEDLINFHMNQPISEAGREVLVTPCGQSPNGPPDYQELFANLANQDTNL